MRSDSSHFSSSTFVFVSLQTAEAPTAKKKANKRCVILCVCVCVCIDWNVHLCERARVSRGWTAQTLIACPTKDKTKIRKVCNLPPKAGLSLRRC